MRSAPHASQKGWSGGFDVPQARQETSLRNGARQPPQNWAASRFSRPQLGQRMGLPILDSGPGEGKPERRRIWADRAMSAPPVWETLTIAVVRAPHPFDSRWGRQLPVRAGQGRSGLSPAERKSFSQRSLMSSSMREISASSRRTRSGSHSPWSRIERHQRLANGLPK